jgi:hypothetical protein
MQIWRAKSESGFAAATTPSPRTLHSELLRLCARIGYSPHLPV